MKGLIVLAACLHASAEHCLRCTPGLDRTNGFFVAVFQRKDFSATSVVSSLTAANSSAASKPRNVAGVLGAKRAFADEAEISEAETSPATISTNIVAPRSKPRGKRVKLSHSFKKK